MKSDKLQSLSLFLFNGRSQRACYHCGFSGCAPELMNIDQIRREYIRDLLRKEDLQAGPLQQFSRWLEDAVDAGLKDPTAMTLATVSADGEPSQRIVLLKGVDERGLVFYTNYDSRKGQDIAANPRVSLHFPWHGLERQVRISGVAEKVSREESLEYFASRPRDSQAAAVVSEQSRPLASRDALLDEFEALKQKYADGEIPMPDFWGGYRVVPREVEFWQGAEYRLHDRFVYRRQPDNSWYIERLAP